MTNAFSPSQNIILDHFDRATYILTPNAQEVFQALLNNYQAGIRTFNLIGAYGTGKSSFLNALNFHLTEEKVFQVSGNVGDLPHFNIYKLIGSYDSIVESVAALIGCDSVKPAKIISTLEELIKASNSAGTGLMLIIDEFGKFLEHASTNGAEKELYFLQQLAEMINNSDHQAAFITTLHQDFGAYAVDLNQTQRNEWTKVKGRFKELGFNEPVEQLLLLASRYIDASPSKQKLQLAKSLMETISQAKAFSLKDYFNDRIAKSIYPLDLLSASVLALSLQQYGQNERSLFTFLNSESIYGIEDFDEDKQEFYAVSNVYDYLNYNLYSFLNSKVNPHYSKWAEIKNALERVEGEVEESEHILYQTIIKTIGLLNIFTHAAARLDEAFLVTYIETTGKLSGVEAAIKNLLRKNLLAYNKYSRRFFYSETTIVDIEEAIEAAGLEVSRANNIVDYLNGYLPLAPVAAKRAYFEKGTPRVFEYKITSSPFEASKPAGAVDGFVNLIFSESLSAQGIIEVSTRNPNAVLYAHFLRTADIQHAIEEIEKAQIAKAKYPNDKIIQRELNAIEDIQRNLLNHYLYEGFFDGESVHWYFRGEKKELRSSRDFNALLSRIIDEVYPNTPTFISELANKSKLSPSISSARRNLIDAILSASDQQMLGIEGFPPQKSIYLSLLLQTGIHKKTAEGWSLCEIREGDEDPSHFLPVFKACQDFLEGSKGAKRSIADLYELLGAAPYKLKNGFLDFWIPIYLIIKTDDFALYGTNGFIPEIDSEVLELLVKNPGQYAMKAYDTDGVKVQLFNRYRDLLALGEAQRTSNEGFIKTIIPFFKFYRELKDYVKQTKNLSKKTMAVRRALTQATEPEKLFFEDLPDALGYDLVQLQKNPELLSIFSADLQECIRELRNAYDVLLQKFEDIICTLWNEPLSFTEYTSRLRARYERSLKKYLLLPTQKTFYDRLCSPLEDRGAWLSSLAQGTVGKTLNLATDKEVDQLQERFLNNIHELDNLNDMAMQKVDIEKEEVFKFELTSPGSATSQRMIRIPKAQNEKFMNLETGVSDLMQGENKSTKIAILAKMLKQVIEEDGKS